MNNLGKGVMPNFFPLPPAVLALCKARDVLKGHYSDSGLTFTLDGKLVGDIGEAVAADIFGLSLCGKRTKAIDAIATDGRTVQIKATGSSKRGPAFTPGEGTADHLIFIYLTFDAGSAEVRYNGPEAPVRALLPTSWSGTACPTLASVVAADRRVVDTDRLAVKDR